MKMSKKEQNAVNKIVCPYCGYEHDPNEDPNFYFKYDETETECENCEKEFLFAGEAGWTFYSSKVDDDEDDDDEEYENANLRTS